MLDQATKQYIILIETTSSKESLGVGLFNCKLLEI